jgi:hypothetical protein
VAACDAPSCLVALVDTLKLRVHLWFSPNLLLRCALLRVLEPGTVCMELCIALQARVQVVDVDEAKRRFWRVTLGLERDTSQQPDAPTQLHYSRQLQSSIVVLDQMCTAVIESLDGVLAQFSSVMPWMRNITLYVGTASTNHNNRHMKY